jgi:hypothetical protein
MVQDTLIPAGSHLHYSMDVFKRGLGRGRSAGTLAGTLAGTGGWALGKVPGIRVQAEDVFGTPKAG